MAFWGGRGAHTPCSPLQVLFVESICDDPAIIEENIKVRRCLPKMSHLNPPPPPHLQTVALSKA